MATITEEESEAAELAKMRKDGFLGAAAGGKAAGGQLEAAPGARRIRRTIVTTSEAGVRSEREVIYADREKARGAQPCLQTLLLKSILEASG
jgi:hypothetical protein